MKWQDKYRFVKQNMKKNKSRIFMTTLATAMGCAFLIVLASVGFGVQKTMVTEVTEGRLLTEIQVHGKMGNSPESDSRILDEDISFMESLPNVKAVTRRQVIENENAFYADEFLEHSQTMTVDYPSEIKAGFELDRGQMPQASNEVVVGYHFQEQLINPSTEEQNVRDETGKIKKEFQYPDDILGKTIQMEIKQFKDGKEISQQFPLKVVGVAKKPTREWMVDSNVFISSDMLKQVEAFTGTPNGRIIPPDMPLDKLPSFLTDFTRSYNEVNIYANDVKAVTDLSETMKEKGYYTYSIANELKQINTVFLIAKIGLLFIGTIAVLIASIGIYNTMSMAVTERAQDIGIMKAIGGHPSTIKSLFLMESSYIGLMGAVIGTIVAYAISYGVNFLLPILVEGVFHENLDKKILLSYIPLSLTLICVAISVGVAILSGWKPANKATKIDVLSALRRDI